MACHPLPTLAVTGFAAGLSALAGLPAGQAALVAATVFAGQLSVGWSNDYLDAARDRAAHRQDKPIATGAIARRTVGIASLAALAATAALSVALGWPAGAVSLVTVLSAWTYNLWLKWTVFSWLPYGLSFGLAPAVVTLADAPPRFPAAWALTALAVLGVAAHLANALPDLRDDVAHGIRGLPHRIGARPTAMAGAALLLVASAVILLGPAGEPGAWRWVAFAVTVIVGGAAAAVAYRSPSSRRFFAAIILIAAIDLVSLFLAGTKLVP